MLQSPHLPIEHTQQMHAPNQSTILTTMQHTETEKLIQNERTQLDILRETLQKEQNILTAKYKTLRESYDQLRSTCSHPREHLIVELEEGAYGGKTKTCSLCGWSHYSD